MSTKQLDTLLKYEQSKEHKLAEALHLAEQDQQQNALRLQSVADYRFEYMKRLYERSLAGIESSTYSHYHAFVSKLDNAAEQVRVALQQSEALMQQRKQQWFEQRRKVEAVEILLAKKQSQLVDKENRKEQRMFDEIATQQFVRRHQ